MDRTPGLLRAARLAAPALLLAAALGLLAYHGAQLWHALRVERAVRQPPAGPTALDAHPSVQFAHAHAHAAAGRRQEALALYLAAAREPRLAAAAHYNSGNLHLREALALAEQGTLAAQPQAAELAKARFREALRLKPEMLPARYNLERALWLAPELPDEVPPSLPPPPAERALTTMRGFTLGLP